MPAYSTAIAAFNIIQLLAMPTLKEINDDYQNVATNYQKLMLRLFVDSHYDSSLQSTRPQKVDVSLIVDHIESINSDEATMLVHGTVTMEWMDSRLQWDPKDFNNMTATNVGVFFNMMWLPNVYIMTPTQPAGKILQFHNSDISFTNTGKVLAVTAVSLTTECMLDYTHYPYDNQTCSAMFIAPYSRIDSLDLSAQGSILRREFLFGDDNAMTINGDYDQISMKAIKYYASYKGMTTNLMKARLNPDSSPVLKIVFEMIRSPGNYYSIVALPLYACSIITYIAVCVTNTWASLSWVTVSMIIQVINGARLVAYLPKDYTTTPFCAKMAYLIFIEAILIFIYRVVIVFVRKELALNGKIQQLRRIAQFETFLFVGLIIHAIVNYSLLLL